MCQREFRQLENSLLCMFSPSTVDICLYLSAKSINCHNLIRRVTVIFVFTLYGENVLFNNISVVFFPTFITVLAEVSYLVFCISWSFHGCLACFLIKTAMKILRKMRTLLVYFHSFCTSVFPTSNLMSSQRPISF